jgi:adhesin/invasin
VTDKGDGTYSATITASKQIGTATITATDISVSPSVSGTASLAQVAPSVSVSLSPSTITADGKTQTTATATVTAGGNPVSDDTVSFTSSDDKEKIGSVTNDGDGKYSAEVTASTKAETATISATDSSVSPSKSGSATLTQWAATTLLLSLSPTSIVADGRATTVATVTVTRGGKKIATDDLSFASTDRSELISSVTNEGNGKYEVSITASHKVASATITATDDSPYPAVSKTATLKQVASVLSLTLKPTSIAANGKATSVATVKVTGSGIALPGEDVTVISSDPGEKISGVTDEGNGSYAATITASTTVGTATITATDTTEGPHPSKTATLKQTAISP